MSHSAAIRDLLTRFPALKPKAIERLLAARGIVVDSNLIGVARLRHRRNQDAKQQAGRIITHLLEMLLGKRPGLLPVVKASFVEVLRRLVDVAAAHPAATDDELADRLATELSNLPSEETPIARWSRIFMLVLEKHPQFRRSMLIVQGWSERAKHHVVVPVLRDENLDLTDEQVEQDILGFLEENFPAGSTVEEIARTYIEALQRREKQAEEVQREAAQAERGRAARVLSMILDDLCSPAVDHDAALAVVQQFVARFTDWPDEAIAERVCAGMDDALRHEVEEAAHIEDLTIRVRP